jgi:hypothetical protein
VTIPLLPWKEKLDIFKCVFFPFSVKFFTEINEAYRYLAYQDKYRSPEKKMEFYFSSSENSLIKINTTGKIGWSVFFKIL